MSTKHEPIFDPRPVYFRREKSNTSREKAIIEAAGVNFSNANCLPNFQHLWDIPCYSPSKDFNVSIETEATTSIFVPSMAEIIQEACGDPK